MLCGLQTSKNNCFVLNIDVDQDIPNLAFAHLIQLPLTYLLV